MRRLVFASLGLLACGSSSPPATTPSDASVTDTPAVTDTGVTADVPSAAPVTVMTRRGPVRGSSEAGVAAFLGIPYAAPPTGARRWRPPSEPDAWTAPFDATRKGAACPQSPGILLGNARTSEDCLTLNVWSPSSAVGQSRRLPVMVFIHGGGFTGGHTSGRDFDGDSLANRGVVVVTFNYRLGQFGFLAHPALAAEDTEHRSSGNYGLLDQQAVLQWVQRNAAAFGGDPANVTLFGESAGSMAVCAHMVSPLARGLFHKAILESGSCAFMLTPQRDPATAGPIMGAESLGRRAAMALGCGTAAEASAATCLRGKTTAEVLAAAPTPVELTRFGVRYQPNIDGYVLPELPFAALAGGRAARVPVIIGTNRDEGTVFVTMSGVTNEATYRSAVQALVPEHVDDVVRRLYPVSATTTPNQAFAAFVADAVFVCPSRSLARQLSPNARTFLYHFTRLNRGGRLLGLGVYHSAELPYVFGNFTGFAMQEEEDLPVVAVTQGYWTRFAATGDPNGAMAVAWPAFTRDNDAHLEIGDMTRAGSGLHRAACDEIESWITPPSP